jgi:hypothetical protein
MSADPNQPPPPPPPGPTEPIPARPGGPPPDGGGRSFWVIVAVVLAILVVAGVVAAIALTGNDEPTVTGPTGATAITSPTGPTQATGPTATGSTGASGDTGSAANLGCPGGPPAPDTLPDGEYFGFIKGMDTSARTMSFDLACFFTGDEANRIAASRGDEVPVPNDVYIVNDNTKVRTLTFDPAAELKLIDWNRCCEHAAGADMEAFASAVDSGDFQEFDGFRYAGAMSTYWVTIENGRVVTIEEQFLP